MRLPPPPFLASFGKSCCLLVYSRADLLCFGVFVLADRVAKSLNAELVVCISLKLSQTSNTVSNDLSHYSHFGMMLLLTLLLFARIRRGQNQQISTRRTAKIIVTAKFSRVTETVLKLSGTSRWLVCDLYKMTKEGFQEIMTATYAWFHHETVHGCYDTVYAYRKDACSFYLEAQNYKLLSRYTMRGFPQKSAAFFLLALAALVATTRANSVVESIQKDLPFDDNGKLTHHHLVYPAGNAKCAAAKQDKVYGFQTAALTGEALQAVFPGANEGDCVAACLEKGVDRSVAHAAMPFRHWDGKESVFKTWFDGPSCKQVEVCLLNYHSRDTPIKIYWLDPVNGAKKEHMDINFGEHGTRCFQSFVGHEFVAEDGDSGEFLETIFIEHITTKAIGVSPPNANPERHNFDKEIVSTLRNEWNRHNRVKRTFSELGFKKGRLPDDIFASMGAFYYNNRQNKVREEWTGKGVFVNWWETDCSFLQIPWAMKAKWQIRLRELVEEWAGVPIEQTDMYGLRRYEHGARLLTHVDREA